MKGFGFSFLIGCGLMLAGSALAQPVYPPASGPDLTPRAWTGATNPVPLYYARQYYDTYTPVYVTGYSGKSATAAQPVLLSLANLAATNVTVTLTNGTRSSVGTNTFTLTNGTTAEIWIDYAPLPREKTNAVYRPFL